MSAHSVPLSATVRRYLARAIEMESVVICASDSISSHSTASLICLWLGTDSTRVLLKPEFWVITDFVKVVEIIY